MRLIPLALLLFVSTLLHADPGRAPQQVRIEAKIIEVNPEATRRLGVDWGSLPGFPRTPGFPAGSELNGIVLSDESVNLEAFFDYVDSGSDVQLLQQPTLVAQPGKPARILIGGDFDASTDAGAVRFKDVGLRLSFTPRIRPDSGIMLDLAIDNLDIRRAPGVAPTPVVETRRVSTNVELHDGQTLAIAGLLDDKARGTAARIPNIASLPGLGNLLADPGVQSGDKELLLMLTPRNSRPGKIGIKTRVMVVSRNAAGSLGIDWQDLPSIQGTQGFTPGSNLNGVILDNDNPALGSFLDNLGDRNRAVLLSNPRVVTRAGNPAQISVGGDFAADTDRGPVEFQGAGITLSVTPQTGPDGLLRMDVQVNQPSLRDGGDGATPTPVIETRKLSTQVRVRDGHTAVIGGILQERDRRIADRVPWIGDLPVLGHMFGNKALQAGKRDLIITVTPRIVGDPDGSGGDDAPAGPGPRTADTGASEDTRNSCVDQAKLEPEVLGGAEELKSRSGSDDGDDDNDSTVSRVIGGFGGLGGFGGSKGGGFSIGGNGSDPFARSGPQDDTPDRDRNPLKRRAGAEVTLPNGQTFTLQGMERRGQTLIGVRQSRDQAKEQGMRFVSMMLISSSCEQFEPEGKYLYEFYEKGRLTIVVDYKRYRNGQLVKHWTSVGSTDWLEKIGEHVIPTWVGGGFEGPTHADLARGGWALVTSWTYERDGQVILQPLVFDLINQEQRAKREQRATQERDAKVPHLGDIPLVGNLFRSNESREESKPETLIFVTPRIARPVD